MAPLEGLRVVDIATFIAAPYCAALLADFGADVIKVEEPGVGDSLRRLGDQYRGEGLWWLQEGRNKQAVTCNLRDPRGQSLLKELVRQADVLVENFRPGTLERWGLGYPELSAINPALIMVRISAYGQTGPAAAKPGFGRVAQAFGGLTYLAGFPDRPPAIPGSATLADYAAGLYAAFATLLAKQHRDRTGEGQVVDVSLYESIFHFLDILAVSFDTLGIVRERRGLDAPHAAPHSHFPTSDGKWVAIACTNDKIYARLCQAIERPDLIVDDRFRTSADRVAHRREIDDIVSSYTTSYPLAQLVARLDAYEVPASPVYSIADIFQDIQYQSRETIVDIDDPRVGHLRVPGVFPRLTKSPGEIKHLGRDLGADNDRVYRELLGHSPEDLAALRDAGVI